MHFDGVESSKNVMNDLTMKKIMNMVIYVWINFWPSGYLKFVLKCFELILFNSPFTFLVVRYTIMPLTSEQNEYVLCLHQPKLIYFLMCSVKKFIINKICNKR